MRSSALSQKQAQEETLDEDSKCDGCHRPWRVRHQCGKDKQVYYFCDTCFEVHRIQAGHSSGYMVDVY